MGRYEKLLLKILSGRADADISFSDLVALLEKHGFKQRTKGSHHIFTRSDIRERLNLQAEGGKAKRYQVKQVRDIFTKYALGDDTDE